ncbi:MAG: STAS domain-containing protein [Breznakibacter sp.]
MIKLFQANSTILISFDKSDNLGEVDIQNLIRVMLAKLKYPFRNVIVDLKGIEDVDNKGLSVLRKAHWLSRANDFQISIFNADDKLLREIQMHGHRTRMFFCDQLSMVS